jgi:2-hydroxy-3-oxopropionate reductase
MSSIPVPTAHAQAERLQALGKHYVDAPVSGGEPGAIAGTLTIMAGGKADIIEGARPLIETMGRLTRVGAAGCGQLAKLANQTIVGITIGAVSEAFLLAEEGGVDLQALLTALQGGFADSSVLRKHGVNIAERRFVPGAHAHVQLKDLTTAQEQARSEELDLIITPVVRALYEDMCVHGRAELDHSGLYLEIASRAKSGRKG